MSIHAVIASRLRRSSAFPLCATARVTALAVLISLLAGCHTTYKVPGGPANFRALGIDSNTALALTDGAIAAELDKKPLAAFPATIAVVRVQDRDYRSHTHTAYGQGSYTVMTARDVETPEHLQRLEKMPQVRSIAAINRLLLPSKTRDEMDLRQAAASVHADMLLLYTFDTVFGSESKIAPLGVITLGLFPEREARVTSTASAVLLDTRNGYVYGITEGTSQTTQLANAWTDRSAVDQSRRRAESEAFDQLVANVEAMWRRVVETYGMPATEHAATTGAEPIAAGTR